MSQKSELESKKVDSNKRSCSKLDMSRNNGTLLTLTGVVEAY